MDPELQKQMAAFEAARIAQPLTLAAKRPARILAVRDGSDQDPTVLALARAVAERFGGEVGEWLGPTRELAHEAILAAAEAADLLVAPCPFDADFGAVGRDTLSTTLDLVLARSPVPVLLARAPVPDPADALRRPLLVLGVCPDRDAEAAAWATSLGEDIGLLAVLDPSQPVPREEVVGRYLDPKDFDTEELHALADSRAAALTAAVQRRVGETHATARLKIRIGDLVTVADEVGTRRGGLLVCGRSSDPSSAALARARALVLRTALPILLV
jgi:nucleotide-binding universal stress UspA family protein